METGQDQEHESINHQTLQDKNMKESQSTSIQINTEETKSPKQVEQEILDMLNKANPTQAEYLGQTRNSHHLNIANKNYFPEDFHEPEEPSQHSNKNQLQRQESGCPEEIIIAKLTMPNNTNKGE